MKHATNRSIAALCLTLSMTVGTACSAAEVSGTIAPSQEEGPQAVVENHNFYDMTIYIVADGLEFRLGSVVTGEVRAFRIPRWVRSHATYRLIADPVGSKERIVSQDIDARNDWVPHFQVNQSEVSSVLTMRRSVR